MRERLAVVAGVRTKRKSFDGQYFIRSIFWVLAMLAFASLGTDRCYADYVVEFNNVGHIRRCDMLQRCDEVVTVGPAKFSKGFPTVSAGYYSYDFVSAHPIVVADADIDIDFNTPVYKLEIYGEVAGGAEVFYRDNEGTNWSFGRAGFYIVKGSVGGITHVELRAAANPDASLAITKVVFSTDKPPPPTPPPSNLTVFRPFVNSDTGDLFAEWAVLSDVPFSPGSTSVGVEVWSGSPPKTKIGAWGLSQCVNQANCYYRIVHRFSERNSIPLGDSYLTSVIDPDSVYKETNENDNVTWTYLDDFFIENIPKILQNKGWPQAYTLLSLWFNGKNAGDMSKLIKNSAVPIDWKKPIIEPVPTTWFLDPKNANNTNRVKDLFDAYVKMRPTPGQPLAPQYDFWTKDAQAALEKMVRAKFDKNKGANSIDLSIPWGSGIKYEDYHNQHFNHNPIKSSFAMGYLDLDAITAAFGNFSFYVVPIGTATRQVDGTYKIKFKQIAIHVSDSFDFNDSAFNLRDYSTWITQLLGCYDLPNVVKSPVNIQLHCVYNSSFQNYRHLKARGQDFTIFTTPYIVTLEQSCAMIIPSK